MIETLKIRATDDTSEELAKLSLINYRLGKIEKNIESMSDSLEKLNNLVVLQNKVHKAVERLNYKFYIGVGASIVAIVGTLFTVLPIFIPAPI